MAAGENRRREESRRSDETRGETGVRGREKRCYFKTILTDNVTLLQSAKRSCHAPV